MNEWMNFPWVSLRFFHVFFKHEKKVELLNNRVRRRYSENSRVNIVSKDKASVINIVPVYFTFSPPETDRVQTWTEGKFTGRRWKSTFVEHMSLSADDRVHSVMRHSYCTKKKKQNKQQYSDGNDMYMYIMCMSTTVYFKLGKFTLHIKNSEMNAFTYLKKTYSEIILKLVQWKAKAGDPNSFLCSNWVFIH